MNNFVKENPDFKIFNGKYGSNNGIDHLIVNTKTKEVWILDSKQMSTSAKTYEGGAIKLAKKGAGGNLQLTNEWLGAIAGKEKLDPETQKILKEVVKNKKYKTGVVALDKKTDELIFVPVKVEKIKKN